MYVVELSSQLLKVIDSPFFFLVLSPSFGSFDQTTEMASEYISVIHIHVQYIISIRKLIRESNKYMAV